MLWSWTSEMRGLDGLVSPSQAQTPPSAAELSSYRGLHAAAAHGSTEEVRRLTAAGADVNARDPTWLPLLAGGEHRCKVLTSIGSRRHDQGTRL